MVRILLVRHAQRLDRFMKDAYPNIKHWSDQVCNPVTTYTTGQFNIEIPPILPKRTSESYADDPPLTTMGEMCAQLLGNRFAELGLTFDLVYSSPSERCIVTCYRILEGYQDFLGDCDLKIRVDGGLYEWGSLSKGAVNFEEPVFYNSRGIPCDMKYKNSIEQEDLKHHAWETYEDFCKRANDWLKKATRDVRRTNVDTILMVSHAPTIVTFVRVLTRKSITEETLENASNRLAYLSAVLLEQHPVTGQWWLPEPQPTPNFEIRAKTSFNQVWLNKTTYDAL